MLNETAYNLGANRSAIRDLFEYGCQRAAVVGRENVYDYSLGNPSIPSPKEVNDTIREVLSDTDPLQVHGYTSAVGDYATRKAISDDLNTRYGVSTVPENFFITCGAAPALVSVLKALSIPGGEVLAIAPYFPEYKPFAEEAGLTFKVVPADEPSFQIDLEELKKRITYHTQAIILNSPNNPSGVIYTRETLEAVKRILFDKIMDYGHTIYLISDEPYRELTYGVEAPWIPSVWSDTIVCYSYSKSLSLPGERIGYVYVPSNCTESKRLFAAVAGAARSAGHVCAPSLWQKVIARCTHLRPDLEAYDRNRKALYEGLTAFGYEMAKPDGAFYLFIKAPGGDAGYFSRRAMQKDLLVVPGDSFGCPGYFRICYCVSWEMIRKSLPVFGELIEEFR
nr:pyridoxal phosphate-dependent aminotransferase [Oscillospiraceae bacterium]